MLPTFLFMVQLGRPSPKPVAPFLPAKYFSIIFVLNYFDLRFNTNSSPSITLFESNFGTELLNRTMIRAILTCLLNRPARRPKRCLTRLFEITMVHVPFVVPRNAVRISKKIKSNDSGKLSPYVISSILSIFPSFHPFACTPV